MDHAAGARLFSQRLANDWDSTFSNRRTESYGILNIPFVCSRFPGYRTAQDIIEYFMRGSFGDPQSYLYQVNLVEGFCKSADLNVLWEGTAPAVTKPVALIDDRNDEGSRLDKDKKGTSRKDLGALSSIQLYRQLVKPVSRA